jgi:methyl-accepting chemotaxis protein
MLSKILLITISFVILISMLIAYVISKNFSMPINNLMQIMGKAQKGDLSVRLNFSYYKEFKILDNAFKAMLDNISNLIGRIGNNSSTLKDSSKYLIDDINASEKSLKKLEIDVEQLQNKLSSINDSDVYNKIANLRIEVQKLNLLLKNIYNSASKFDNIALSLDKHVKLFVIDNSSLEE